jgi:hypothetical protein
MLVHENSQVESHHTHDIGLVVEQHFSGVGLVQYMPLPHVVQSRIGLLHCVSLHVCMHVSFTPSLVNPQAGMS